MGWQWGDAGGGVEAELSASAPAPASPVGAIGATLDGPPAGAPGAAALRRRKAPWRNAPEDAGMTRRILILHGHPDTKHPHLCHALAESYAAGAESAGHAVRRIDIGTLDFPLLRSKAEWDEGALPAGLAAAQADIAWAEHLVLLFPLWLGGMPALVKGFLEQVARPGFALSRFTEGRMPKKLLAGRSARIVVTMGMPALVYRWYFRAHSLKALERNILGFVGIAPIHETLVGSVESLDDKQRAHWSARLRRLGREGG
jgi:putative NADPH-quinone reductase